jgi:hypothetical protein
MRFVFSGILSTVLCTVLWQEFVTDHFYHCADSLGFDFLRPGGWVHGVAVPHGDTLRQGWSRTGLWYLWCSFVMIALLISVIFALLPWGSRDEGAA